MTEYGRGPSSEPWHPDDPLYGDREWTGVSRSGHDWDPYGGQRYPARQPQQTRQYPAPSYSEQEWGAGDGGRRHADPYGPYSGDTYGGGHHAGPHGGGPYPAPQGRPDAPEPYPPHPEQQYEHQQPPYGQPPQGRQHEEPDPGPDEEAGWDPAPKPDGDGLPADREGGADTGGRPARGSRLARGRDRRGRGRGKGRNGAARLAVAVVVVVGGVGTAGYFAYDVYRTHFAAAPDFPGRGRGEVQVEIPQGIGLAQMGAILEKAGVVKSREAFVEATNAHARARSIQSGVYMLRRGMSAEAAVEMMLDPSSQNALIIAEGKRASEVYALIDEKLGVAEGTTEEAAERAAEKGHLGLPPWAEGNPEGFLFPAKYAVSDKTTPEELLRKMVERAEREFARIGLENRPEQLGLDSPLEVLTVASLVQAEGKYKHDFVKVARVVYNRLKPGNTETNGYLQFDSTYNYAKNQYTLDVPPPSAMAKFDHPYNTYGNKGLPPGPINSPGLKALNAALEPAEGDWYYFVSVTADNTVFSETYEEHKRHVARYEEAKQ